MDVKTWIVSILVIVGVVAIAIWTGPRGPKGGGGNEWT